MSSPDPHTVLASLLSRVPGSRDAILLDRNGGSLAQASQDPALDLATLSARCLPLLTETLAAADRLGQGAVADVLVQAERATLAMFPLKDARCLCLVLDSDAVLGRGLFEARRAAASLDDLR